MSRPQLQSSQAGKLATVTPITSEAIRTGTSPITVQRSSQPCCNRSFTHLLHKDVTIRTMQPNHSPLLTQALSCWNWKCALLSASARSIIYLAALAHSGPHKRLSIVLVEIAYVTLTAGIYAGLQQRALDLHSRLLGNLTIAIAVPALSQILDWLAHRAVGATVPLRAIVAVSVFTLVSALFHLFVMRRGVFLSGEGRSLADDFRRIPRLVAGFVTAPVALVISLVGRSNPAVADGVETEAA